MSLNIPKDPHAIDPSQISSQPSGSIPDTPRPLTPTRDTLVSASTDEVSTCLAPQSSATPELATPQSSPSVDHFKVWIDAVSSFRNQLSASERANLEVRSKFSKLALEQAQEFEKLIIDKEEAIARIKKEIQSKLDELQKKIAEMEDLAKKQQSAIDQINGGNKREQEEYAKLKTAYDDYIASLTKIGVVDLGKGNFYVPESAREKFNELTSKYQQAVKNFNAYWSDRAAQINQYNTTTTAYNQKVAEYNALIERFVQDNNLAEYLKLNKITLPQLSPASRRDISGYQERINFPSTISGPTFISIPTLPAYVRDIAQAGPSALPKLPNFPSFDTQRFFQPLYQEAYESFLHFIEEHGTKYTSYWSFIMHGVEDESLSTDPLLNSKRLAQKLNLPRSSTSASSLVMQALGTDNPHIQTLLGKAILREVIKGAKLEALEKLNYEEKERQLELLADRILLLSLGLLGSLNTQALFPSLGIISDAIASLPKDSPVIAILFAVSLANRIQENVKQGLTTEAVEHFLNTIPELAALSDEDKAKLGAALNLGQLLIAGKLLEENLGIQDLCANLLPLISPAINSSQILSQARQENQENLLAQHHLVKEHFIHQGYSEDQAQFLAQVSVELTAQGLLAPQITSPISARSIHQPSLENSIKAGLVLAHYPIEEASRITHEAITATLSEGSFASVKQFRATLESHLADLQVKNSPDIAAFAILMPADKGLAPTISLPSTRPSEGIPTTPLTFSSPLTSSTPSQPMTAVASNETPPIAPSKPAQPATTVASTETPSLSPTSARPVESVQSPSPTPPLTSTSSSAPVQPAAIPSTTASSRSSQDELISHLEKQIVPMLTPQLGAPLAKQVAQEVAKTIFGTVQPESVERTQTAPAPYALVSTIREQLQHFNIQQDHQWTQAVTETFKESIKTMESFYSFSLKLMNPAYLYVFASEIIYGDKGKKKAIDIPI